MTPPSEISRVAGGLTKAQRDALSVILPRARAQFGNRLAIARRESTAMALERRGLIENRRWISGDITDLGLAVRAHLENEHD